MRARRWVAAVLAMAWTMGAHASGNMAATPPGIFPGATLHSPSAAPPAWSRPGNGWGFGHGNPNHHGPESQHFHHNDRQVYVYPGYVQQAYDVSDDADSGNEQPDVPQIEYVQMPPPMVPTRAPALPAPPAAPTTTVHYATTGQPIQIPVGARVTKGSVYKYTRDGVNTYTNVPPPQTAGAKLLFGYTEVVSSNATHTMYRCVGAKGGQVGYSDTPVPAQDCKAVNFADASAN